MICLNDTDTLEAWSGTAAVVDYTVHALVGTAFTELAAGVLGNVADAVIYTAAAAISLVSVIFVNTDTSADTVNFRIYPADGGNPRYLIPKAVSLGPAYSLHTDGARISIMNPTGAIVYTYLAHTHDGDTLQLDGVNSNGGAFAFTTTGPVTHNQNLIIPDAGNIGSVSDTDAIAIANDGTLHFSGQSGFTASLSAEQDIPNAELTIAQFDTEEDDIQGELNVGTYTWTAAKDGKYQVSAAIGFVELIADAKFIRLIIYKNGAAYGEAQQPLGVARYPATAVSIRMPLDATDTIDIRVYHNHTEARKLYPTASRFSIAKVG